LHSPCIFIGGCLIEPDGKGTLTYADRSVYEGEFKKKIREYKRRGY
jgi:hypothetical protein